MSRDVRCSRCNDEWLQGRQVCRRCNLPLRVRYRDLVAMVGAQVWATPSREAGPVETAASGRPVGFGRLRAAFATHLSPSRVGAEP